ncbi:MAG: LOG family protein [Ignavibacteriae bacterium]|nr:LOG family protein [Ignavibacteriota bacterium]NOG97881.1 LOG family protein [Ignavibacteriota bacterium]
MKNKTVTIFGSSKPVAGEPEYEAAYLLGKLLAEKNLSVCSGGYQGIMDAVSKGAAERGAEAIGVTVDIFNAVPSKHLTKEIECRTLCERIDKLISLGDAYIVLDGGTGTLVELSIVWEYFNKNLNPRKPFACVGNMWNEIITVMEKRIFDEGRATGLIKNFADVELCADYIIGELNSK